VIGAALAKNESVSKHRVAGARFFAEGIGCDLRDDLALGLLALELHDSRDAAGAGRATQHQAERKLQPRQAAGGEPGGGLFQCNSDGIVCHRVRGRQSKGAVLAPAGTLEASTTFQTDPGGLLKGSLYAPYWLVAFAVKTSPFSSTPPQVSWSWVLSSSCMAQE